MHSVPGEDGDETLESVALPYPLATCLDLWAAWEKGVMPNPGGYFDQPRRWRDMIHAFNRFYNRTPKPGQKEQSDEDFYRGLADGNAGTSSRLPPADGWDAFAGGG